MNRGGALDAGDGDREPVGHDEGDRDDMPVDVDRSVQARVGGVRTDLAEVAATAASAAGSSIATKSSASA